MRVRATPPDLHHCQVANLLAALRMQDHDGPTWRELCGESLAAAVLAGGRTAGSKAVARGAGGAWQKEWVGERLNEATINRLGSIAE
jgi:hypothetical protein